jgi:acetoin utilization protein AcuB
MTIERPTTVEDVMTSDPVVASPETTVGEAHEMMARLGFRHLPIVDGSRLVGILSTTDIGRLAVGVPELMAKLVAELMTSNPLVIEPSERIEVAAAQMALRKVNSLPVVRAGALVGIVTTYDLLDALARRLRAGI